MVLFFDIDGTLLSTTGAGVAAMQTAARRRFGEAFSFDGIPVAGRLDPLIIADAFARNGIADTPEHHAALRADYVMILESILVDAAHAEALPGVHDLLAALAEPARHGRVTLALLTGNFEETGLLKLRRCGIDPALFAFGVYGDHAPASPPKREDLVPVGMERARSRGTRSYSPGEFVVIGDTPHDVRCAVVHGGRSLAVATGRSSVEELRSAGADLAVPDLRDTRGLVDWMLGRLPA
jgi:phosphoglycolate phosphatase